MRQSLLLLAVLSLTACESGDRSAGRGGPPGFSRGPTYVVAKQASVRTIRSEVEAIGTAKANESVTIAAKVTDTISKVNFEDGDFVEKGDVLVELTNQEESALLDEARANRDDWEQQYNRLESLRTDSMVPLSQVDEAHSRLLAAQARYKSLVARMDDRLVRAPFKGKLGFRKVSAGTLLTPGSEITTLDDISIIKLDFSIAEVYLDLVEEGLELVAMSSAFPDLRFDATVKTIDSRVDQATRTAKVRAHIENEDLKLMPGMLLTVRLTTQERSALMVPEIALVQRASQVFVYTISGGEGADDGMAEMLEVESGERHEGWIEILSGISEGQKVITQGVIKVRDGSPVTTTQIAAPAGSRPAGGRGTPGGRS